MPDFRCTKCKYPCIAGTNNPKARIPKICLYGKKAAWRRVIRDARAPRLVWKYIFADRDGTRYGNLMMGKRIEADGVVEQFGIIACKRYNREE